MQFFQRGGGAKQVQTIEAGELSVDHGVTSARENSTIGSPGHAGNSPAYAAFIAFWNKALFFPPWEFAVE
ncbi:hypothetical protein D3C79_918520 [compost metagenome]